MEKTVIAGRICYFLENTNQNQTPVVYLGTGSGMENILLGLEKRVNKEREVPCRIVAYESEQWDGDFSPWFWGFGDGKRQFAGNGAKTLHWLQEQCIPAAEKQFGLQEPVFRYLAGYSMAGLFSLWAYYESRQFQGVASCSGSLWFEGWNKYAAKNPAPSPGRMYFSLGRKEEKTRHPILCQITEATRQQYARCRKVPGIHSTLEWQDGGHFHQVDERLFKGIFWLLKESKC